MVCESGAPPPVTLLHRKFELDTGDNHAVELFRATNKALTISGLDLRQGRSLGSIDRLMDWCVFYRGEAQAGAEGGSCSNSLQRQWQRTVRIDEIEQIVSNGAPADGNRSNLFHTDCRPLRRMRMGR